MEVLADLIPMIKSDQVVQNMLYWLVNKFG